VKDDLGKRMSQVWTTGASVHRRPVPGPPGLRPARIRRTLAALAPLVAPLGATRVAGALLLAVAAGIATVTGGEPSAPSRRGPAASP
jgi:hypothetical protein